MTQQPQDLPLRLDVDPVALTARLVDIASPSHSEKEIADAIEAALLDVADTHPGVVEVARHQNTVLARTNRGFPSRVLLAGHVDTVPLADNVPHRRGRNDAGEDTLFGCGTVDMKSGLAIYLHAFATLAAHPDLTHDLTVVAYEGEEVATEFNGLGHVQKVMPEWLKGDLALLGEPSGALIEAGCQGTIRVKVTAKGTRAHSARAWLGVNAAHRLVPVLERVATYRARDHVEVGGCVYREGLNVVHMESGVATNTIPDEAMALVNFRFAPDRSVDNALQHLREILNVESVEGVTVEVDDVAGAAAPGLDRDIARELIEAVGGPSHVRAKYGWTDVARFGELGIPAVNFGSGDPGYAHKKDEQCPVWQIESVSNQLLAYLTGCRNAGQSARTISSAEEKP